MSIIVNWNGEQYPFSFQIAKSGTPAPAFTPRAVPAYVPAIDRTEPAKASSYLAHEQLPTSAPVGRAKVALVIARDARDFRYSEPPEAGIEEPRRKPRPWGLVEVKPQQSY